MKKFVASMAVVAFLAVMAAPSFGATGYDKDPKAAKTETKKGDAKASTGKTGSCSSNSSCCKSHSATTESKSQPSKK